MLLAHAGGALYGTGLGLVTLKRIGFFCFPIIDSLKGSIEHSKHAAVCTVQP